MQNFAVSFSASAAVSAIGFLLTPIISRIYQPAAYGQFAVFSSLLNNLMLVSTLTLPGAMLLPKLRQDSINLMNAIVVLTLGAVGAVTLLLVFFNGFIVNYLQIPALSKGLLLLPVALLLANGGTLMGFWYIRKKAFGKRASVDITTTLASRGMTIGAGLLLHGNGIGLLFGEIANRVAYFTALMARGFHKEVAIMWRRFSWQGIREAIIEYKDFPLYVLPANYANALSAQVPVFLLTSSFGSTIVGLYSFSVSLLEVPLTLVGSAIAPVFMQKATEVQHTDSARLGDITLSLYNKLLYIGLLPFGFITIFGDVLFRTMFGEKWEMAGVFTAYLGYYYIFKLSATVTAPVYTVIKKQKYALISSVMLLVVRTGSLLLGIAMHDIDKTLLMFGVGSLLVSFLTDLHILYLLRAPVLSTAIRTIVLSLLTVGFMWALRQLGHQYWPQWL